MHQSHKPLAIVHLFILMNLYHIISPMTISFFSIPYSTL